MTVLPIENSSAAQRGRHSRRTVAAALRAVGLGDERRFTTYHRVLNRSVWSALVPEKTTSYASTGLWPNA